MSTRGVTRVISDMDEHSKVKADAKLIVKEAYDTLGTKDDKVVAGFIKVCVSCSYLCVQELFLGTPKSVFAEKV
jgi:hypothetical protein